MFVRKDKDGNLVAVGSIDSSLLAQLQRESKKDSAKVPSLDAEPTPATDEPPNSPPAATEPKAKSSTKTSRP